MTVLVLPLHLPLRTLLPGGQHGAVVRDGVVHAQEQHVLLTWSVMRLLRHGTKEHSHAQESLIIIDLCNYTLITFSLHDGLSDLLQHFTVCPMRVLYQTWGHTPYRLDGQCST